MSNHGFVVYMQTDDLMFQPKNVVCFVPKLMQVIQMDVLMHDKINC